MSDPSDCLLGFNNSSFLYYKGHFHIKHVVVIRIKNAFTLNGHYKHQIDM